MNQAKQKQEAQDTVKVIAKIAKGECELFFPEYEVNRGRIACWAFVGQHGEADIDYYNQCRNPKNSAEEALVKTAIKQYERGYNTTCIRVHRQSRKQREAAWV